MRTPNSNYYLCGAIILTILEGSTSLYGQIIAGKEPPRIGDLGVAQVLGETPDGAVSALVISTDIDCFVVIDGSDPYRVDTDAPTNIRVPIGSHLLTAVTVDGQDYWEGRILVESAGGQRVTIDLSAARSDRIDRETELVRLQESIDEREFQLDDVTRVRQETAEKTQRLFEGASAQTVDVRLLVVKHIERLESVLRYETAEVTRLEQQKREAEIQQAGGGLGGLIGTIASTKFDASARTHQQRADRLLSKIDSLTTRLGSVEIDENTTVEQFGVPSREYPIDLKKGNKWVAVEFVLSDGSFSWRLPTTEGRKNDIPTSVLCQDLKSIKRLKNDELELRSGKSKLVLRTAVPGDRGKFIEALFLVCPDRVDW